MDISRRLFRFSSIPLLESWETDAFDLAEDVSFAAWSPRSVPRWDRSSTAPETCRSYPGTPFSGFDKSLCQNYLRPISAGFWAPALWPWCVGAPRWAPPECRTPWSPSSTHRGCRGPWDSWFFCLRRPDDPEGSASCDASTIFRSAWQICHFPWLNYTQSFISKFHIFAKKNIWWGLCFFFLTYVRAILASTPTKYISTLYYLLDELIKIRWLNSLPSGFYL